MKEIWKDIIDFEGYYQISNYGRVKSLKRIITMKNGRLRPIKERILSPKSKDNDYLFILLCKDGNQSPFYIHRLVAIHFIDNPLNKEYVNHKDGDKTNTYYKNLEWATFSENMIHAYKTGLAIKGENHTQAKLTNEQVAYIKENYKGKDRMFGAKPLAIKFGVSRGTIWGIANGTKRIDY